MGQGDLILVPHVIDPVLLLCLRLLPGGIQTVQFLVEIGQFLGDGITLIKECLLPGGVLLLARDSFGKFGLALISGVYRSFYCLSDLPDILFLHEDNSIETLASFGYDDFKYRLGRRK